MGGLEDRMPGLVVDVAAGSDPDSTDLGCEGIGDVVAVQVHRGDDVVFGGSEQDLLKKGVGNGVLDQQLVSGVPARVLPGDGTIRELLLNHLVTPLAKRPFGELHDVALVDERHRLRACWRGRIDRSSDRGAWTRYSKTGLMPRPESGRISQPNSVSRNSSNACGPPR